MARSQLKPKPIPYPSKRIYPYRLAHPTPILIPAAFSWNKCRLSRRIARSTCALLLLPFTSARPSFSTAVSTEIPGDEDNDVPVSATDHASLRFEEARGKRLPRPNTPAVAACAGAGGGGGGGGATGAGADDAAFQADDARSSNQVAAHRHHEKLSSFRARSSSGSVPRRFASADGGGGGDGDGGSRTAQTRARLASAPKQLVRRPVKLEN